MKTQGAHAHEERLLDFAYGELAPSEAQLVEQHVQGCTRCSDTLESIRGVRTTMSRLPLETAPDAGLESLMAYAQQAARRSAAGPEPAPRWWRRLLAPALGVAALSVFGIVVVQVNREVDLGSSLQKGAAKEQAPHVSNKDMGAGSTATPAAPAPSAAPVPTEVGEMHAQLDERIRDEQPAAPKPTKSPPTKSPPSKPGRRFERADWSNVGAGSAGGFPDKKSALDSDEEVSGLAGLGSKGSSLRTRGVSVSKSQPVPSSARPERARDEAMAEAEAAGPAPETPMPAEPTEYQAEQRYVAPAPKQKLIGSASRSASVASLDSMGDDAQQAPGRAQVASAAPPPPPPAAQYQPPAAAAGSAAQMAGLEAKKAEVAQGSREKSADPRSSPAPAALLRQADVAYRSGDKAQEAAFLRAALSAGIQGTQRLEALSRLCDAEFVLGHRQNALDICKRVMMEAPGSSEARVAQRRLELELQSPADEAGSEQKAASPVSK